MGQPGLDSAEERDFGQWRSEAQYGKSPKVGGSKAEPGPEQEGKNQCWGRDQFETAAKPDSPVSQTGPSSFFGFRVDKGFKDYHA
jgi:hypothetical protein